jgi:hypothetical protein
MLSTISDFPDWQMSHDAAREPAFSEFGGYVRMHLYGIEVCTRAHIDDRIAEARHAHLVELARSAAGSTPSFITPVRRRVAASLRGLARRLDGETLVAAPC